VRMNAVMKMAMRVAVSVRVAMFRESLVVRGSLCQPQFAMAFPTLSRPLDVFL
jgi:hypothetical protein